RAVAICEICFAADRRTAETVAVVAYSSHDARNQTAILRLFEKPESEAVENGERTSAHCEDIAQYSADPRRRALIRLDKTRMVVRFDLEGNAPIAAYIDYTRILAGSLKNTITACRKAFQMHARRFVGAVLRPHH